MKNTVLALGALALTMLAPHAALADALAPPPTDCPAGSIGATSRRGEHCEHAPCEGACAPVRGQPALECSDADVPVCVETRAFVAEDVQQGPRMVSLPAETWQVVHGPCDASGGCARGTCVRRRACVPEGSAYAGGVCSARVGAGRAPAASLLGLVVLALLAARRARRSAKSARPD